MILVEPGAGIIVIFRRMRQDDVNPRSVNILCGEDDVGQEYRLAARKGDCAGADLLQFEQGRLEADGSDRRDRIPSSARSLLTSRRECLRPCTFGRSLVTQVLGMGTPDRRLSVESSQSRRSAFGQKPTKLLAAAAMGATRPTLAQ